MLELRSQNDFELHVKDVEKRGTRIEKQKSGKNLARFDHSKSEILSDVTGVKYKDFQDMVYKLDLAYNETVDIMDVKNFAASSTAYTLPAGLFEISDLNMILQSLLPDDMKVDNTTDNITPRSNLIANKTMKFDKKSFLFAILDFTQSHPGDLGKIDGFIEKRPGSYISEEQTNITGIDKIHLKCDCINGRIDNGIPEPILFNSASRS